MDLKWKIISSVMLLVIVITGVFIAGFYQYSHKNIEQQVNHLIEDIQSIAHTHDEYHKIKYRSRIKSFINPNSIPAKAAMIKSFAHQDRENLLQLTSPFLKLFKNENNYFSTLAWITPNNRSFLRVHFPGKSGDDISAMRPDVVNTNRLQKQHAGYVVAGQGVQYTVVQPILYHDRHIGAVQFGIKGDFLLDAVHKHLQSPVAILIPNEKFKFIVDPELPTFPGASYTLQSKDPSFFEPILDKVDWNLDRQQLQLQNKTYVIVKALNFLNYADQPQGSVIVALDISQPLAEINKLFAWVVVLSILLLTGSFLILYFSFGFLLYKINDLNQSLQQNNAALEQQAIQMQQERDKFMDGPVMTFTWLNVENSPVEYASGNVRDILGYSVEEFINGSVRYMSRIHPDDQQRVLQEIADNVADRKTSFTHEPYRLTTKTGDTVWVLDTTTIIRNQQNKVSHFQGYLVDITATVQMEEEARATKERLEFVIEGARLGTWDWNVKTGEELFNERCAEMLGYKFDELKQHISTWKNLIHPDDAAEVMRSQLEHLNGHALVYMSEHRLRHKSGHWIWVLGVGKVIERDDEGAPLRVVGILLDISRQKEQEKQRLQTSRQQEELKRLDSLRTMASSIAHRFNNSMMAVQGNLELLTLTLPEDSEGHKMASDAAQAARGAVKVGTMMLSYVGQKQAKFKENNFIDLVEESVSELQDILQPPVSLIFTSLTKPLPCSMDERQLKEVIESILINSVESLKNGGGIIKISFGSEYCARDSFPLPFKSDELKDGAYAFCRIKDNGHGIEPENLSRIFEPFYTTRFLGRGLGLALTVGIMRSHHGAIMVESTLEKGTTFSIMLPALLPTRQVTKTSPADSGVAGQLSGAVLLADDEPGLLTVGEQLLELLGFTVHSVTNGQDAVDRVRKGDVDFCAIILDVSMPVMDGIEAMKEIRKIDHSLPIILSSGYSEEDFSLQDGQRHDAFLAKPFQLSDMRDCIEKVLV